MLVELALDHLIGCLSDELHLVLGQLAKVEVHDGRGLLQYAECPDHLARHHVEADIEMLQAPLRLRSPVGGVRHLDLAHRICFNTCGF